jgi:beta-phosphoglucomutase-like phosphatase (HAD superfamily)
MTAASESSQNHKPLNMRDLPMGNASVHDTLYGERLVRGPVRPVAGVEGFLRGSVRLRVPCVLATSAQPPNVERVLGKLGLRESFLAWVTAADVTHGKPAPEVYLKAAARAGVAPQRCLVIEDALAGVQAAKAAGAACLGLTTSGLCDRARRKRRGLDGQRF